MSERLCRTIADTWEQYGCCRLLLPFGRQDDGLAIGELTGSPGFLPALI
jgi:hypothetical protein